VGRSHVRQLKTSSLTLNYSLLPEVVVGGCGSKLGVAQAMWVEGRRSDSRVRLVVVVGNPPNTQAYSCLRYLRVYY
jgi:hypothetical protein